MIDVRYFGAPHGSGPGGLRLSVGATFHYQLSDGIRVSKPFVFNQLESLEEGPAPLPRFHGCRCEVTMHTDGDRLALAYNAACPVHGRDGQPDTGDP
jgi:hypothetical protein